MAKTTKTAAKKSGGKGTSGRGKGKTAGKNKGSLFSYIFWFIIASVFSGLFLYYESDGFVSRAVNHVLYGLLGKPAAALPVVFFGLAVYVIKQKSSAGVRAKLIFSLLAVINMSALVHLFTGDVISAANAYEYAANPFADSVGGGVLGAVFAYPLFLMIKRAAAVILLIITLFILVSAVSGISLFSAAAGIIHGIAAGLREESDNIDPDSDYRRADETTRRTVKRIRETHERFLRSNEENFERGLEFIDEARSFADDKEGRVTKNPFADSDKDAAKEDAKPSKRRRGKSESAQEQNADEPAEDNGINEIFGKLLDDREKLQNVPASGEALMRETLEQEEKARKKEKSLTEKEKESLASEIEENTEPVVREYIYPSVDLLKKPKDISGDQRMAMYETANQLISILENFGVKAKLLQVTQGPSVTRYEIQPSTGIKLAKIQGLADDLALNLAVTNVLVAPVPGKAAVGIEVPNREVSSVSGRELLESDEFKKSKSKLTVALGKDIGGRVVVGDIAKMPHVLIAGATGSGKSVCINTIITSILYKASPDEVKLIMVDPKVVELGVYNGIPHLLIPVVTDPKRAAGALNWAVAEMMHRYDLFANNAVRNLEGYNQLMEKQKMARLPQIVIIIDELADLMMVAAKEVEDYICRLAQLARAAGIHLIIATQRPSVDVITGLIKANVPSRIAFSVSSQVDSRTILDRGGAEKLLGRGDMLYYPTGARVPQRVQGAFISDAEIEKVIDFIKTNNSTDDHYSEDLQEHIDRVSTGENGVTPDEKDDGDELLPQAIEIAAELGQISTAMIQRKLKVGYSRAGRIIDQMEERGIISGANGSKPRQVYVNRADVMSMSMQSLAEEPEEEEYEEYNGGDDEFE